jgi:hypothetical protein
MANDVVTLRISDEAKEKLRKVYGENATTSDMIRGAIDSFLEGIDKAQKGIVSIELPVNCLKGEDLKNLYNDVCELEQKTTNSVISSGHDYDLDYLKALQGAKNLLVAHMSIEHGSQENKKELQELKDQITKKNKK